MTKERARILNGLKSKGIAEKGCGLSTLPMILRYRPGHPITSDASDRRHRNPQTMTETHSPRNRLSWCCYEAVALDDIKHGVLADAEPVADFPVYRLMSVSSGLEPTSRRLAHPMTSADWVRPTRAVS